MTLRVNANGPLNTSIITPSSPSGIPFKLPIRWNPSLGLLYHPASPEPMDSLTYSHPINYSPTPPHASQSGRPRLNTLAEGMFDRFYGLTHINIYVDRLSSASVTKPASERASERIISPPSITN